MQRIFLSHSTLDHAFIDNILLPAFDKNGIEVWYSQKSIVTAEEWANSILQGLRGSDWFLVILTPNAAKSKWLKTEVDWAFENRQDRIIPLFLTNCNLDDIYLKLRTIQYVDFRDDQKLGLKKLFSIWDINYKPFLPVAASGSLNTKENDNEIAKTAADKKSSIGLDEFNLIEQLYILCSDESNFWPTTLGSDFLTRFGLQTMALAELIFYNKMTLETGKIYHPINAISVSLNSEPKLCDISLIPVFANLTARFEKKSNQFHQLDEIDLHSLISSERLIDHFKSKMILKERKSKLFFGLMSVTEYLLIPIDRQKKARKMFFEIINSNSSFSDDIALMVLVADSCNCLNKRLIPQTFLNKKDIILNVAKKNYLAVQIKKLLDCQISRDASDASDAANNSSYHIACS